MVHSEVAIVSHPQCLVAVFRHTTPNDTHLSAGVCTLGQRVPPTRVMTIASLRADLRSASFGTSVGANDQVNLADVSFKTVRNMLNAAWISRSASNPHPGHLKRVFPPSLWCNAPHLQHVFDVHSSVTTNTFFSP